MDNDYLIDNKLLGDRGLILVPRSDDGANKKECKGEIE